MTKPRKKADSLWDWSDMRRRPADPTRIVQGARHHALRQDISAPTVNLVCCRRLTGVEQVAPGGPAVKFELDLCIRTFGARSYELLSHYANVDTN